MRQKLKYYKLFWAIFALVLIIDQLTKHFVRSWFARADVMADASHGIIDVVPGLLRFVYVKNTGAAWGMMSGSVTILGLLAVLALVSIYFLRRALQIKRTPMQVAFGLLVAGIAGNMIDRLTFGYVVDFIDFNFSGWSFPTFNVADMGISIGVFLYILISLFEAPKKPVENLKDQGSSKETKEPKAENERKSEASRNIA